MTVANIPVPKNEPVLGYAPCTPERAALKSALATMREETAEIPAVVGGRQFRSGKTIDVVAPHDHRRVLAVLRWLES